MGMEFELKYSATAEQLVAIAEAYLLNYRIFHMETTYYDAPDAALSDRRITLRRRMENGVSVCTVKTPICGHGRGEWECRSPDIQAAIPELCERGAPRELLHLTAQGVRPVCGAKFQRRAGTLEFRDAMLELALDQGVLLGGEKQIPLCEVEVELKAGNTEAVVAFAAALSNRFGLEPEPKSKFRRALALAKGDES